MRPGLQWGVSVVLASTWLALVGVARGEHALFREDFESLNQAAWSPDGDARVREQANGNGVLRVSGRQQKTHRIPCEPLRDFVLKVDVRGPGGIHFRDGYKVFFKGDGTLWMRRPGVMLLRWVRERRNLEHFHRIRAIAAGRILRVYVDGVLELECLDHEPAARPFFLCGSGDFDNLSISGNLPPEETLMVVPQDAGANFYEEHSHARIRPSLPRVPDVALAFGKDEAVAVPLRVFNEGGEKQRVFVRGVLDDFMDRTVADSPRQTVTVSAGTAVETVLDFGKVPPGFFRLPLELRNDRGEIRTVPYPVFVGLPPEPETFRKPSIAFGVFLATVVWKPFHTKTYWHGIASLLRANRLNTVVATGGCHRQFPEIFQRYGIATLVRSKNRLEHPAVLGMLNSTSDPERMLLLQKTHEKPVLTYLPVEAVGGGTAEDPLRVWAATRPDIRLLRIHPFRHDRPDWLAGEPSTLPEALSRLAKASDTPWWALLQAIGQDAPDGAYRNPTPAELTAQAHLALAYGAKGLLFYALQGSFDHAGLVDPLSLRPADAKLAALRMIGERIETGAESLRAFRSSGERMKAAPATAIAVAGSVGAAAAAYVVNTDVRQPAECVLPAPVRARGLQARDIFGGRIRQPVPPDAPGSVRIWLLPGGGCLLVFEDRDDLGAERNPADRALPSEN